MYKNMLKRSWRSITRRPGRTIILTLVFFAMATMVLAGLMIKSSVSAQLAAAKQSAGGTVTIQPDMDKIRQNQAQQEESGTNKRDIFGTMTRPAISVKTANKIASYTDYVKDYSYQLSAKANAGGLSTVSGQSGGGNIPGGPGQPSEASDSGSETALDTNLTISGVSSYQYIDSVESGELTLKSGNTFDEDSDNKALVSYEFAKLNNLGVGDTVKLKNAYTEKEIELSVCGIYDSSAFNASGNTIYTNVATAAKFLSDDDYNDGDYTVSDVKYYMVDSGQADEFVAKIGQDFPSLSNDNLKVSVDTSEYDQVKKQTESISKFADIVLLVVIIAAVVIIALIVTLNIRDRRYEMGVLLSLGARRLSVIGQFATELVIIGTFGLALASATGTIFAKSIGNSMVQAQISSTNQQSDDMRRPDMGGGAQAQPSSGSSSNSSDKAEEVSANKTSSNKSANSDTKAKLASANKKRNDIQLNINASASDYLTLFLAGYGIILLSMIIPTITIMRYQPKKILEGRE